MSAFPFVRLCPVHMQEDAKPKHMQKQMDGMMRIPANGFALFHWSTSGGNMSRKVAMHYKFSQASEHAGLQTFKNAAMTIAASICV